MNCKLILKDEKLLLLYDNSNYKKIYVKIMKTIKT